MENKYFVYVLRSQKDGRRYVGFTNCLERRIEEHKQGLVKSTKHRRPFEFVYSEKFLNKRDAQEREKFLKTGQGRQYLKDIGK